MIGQASGLTGTTFELDFDAKARAWLEKHPSREGLVVAFEVHRCCGGGKVCDVRIHQRRPQELPREALLRIGTVAGRDVLLDPRISNTMPNRIAVTVRGVGPLRGLSLDLTGPEWGRLLYT